MKTRPACAALRNWLVTKTHGVDSPPICQSLADHIGRSLAREGTLGRVTFSVDDKSEREECHGERKPAEDAAFAEGSS
jgi:hypothetical protein